MYNSQIDNNEIDSRDPNKHCIYTDIHNLNKQNAFNQNDYLNIIHINVCTLNANFHTFNKILEQIKSNFYIISYVFLKHGY